MYAYDVLKACAICDTNRQLPAATGMTGLQPHMLSKNPKHASNTCQVTVQHPAAHLLIPLTPRQLLPYPADPSADHSSSLPLVMSGIARLLQHPSERHTLLPHLGYAAALAVQALDPARPSLRAAMYQPVTALVKELTSSFPQVACHGSSLQLAVGSSRPLGLKPKEASSAASAAAAGSVVAWSGFDPVAGFASRGVDAGSAPALHLSGELLQAAAVAVFDMNGGTKRKVLLLPVLLQHQQQQGLQLGASAMVSASVSSVSVATSYSSSSGVVGLQLGTGGVPVLQQQLPGGIAGLWSGAEGYGGSDAAAAAAALPAAGDSCSSLSSISAADAMDAAAYSYSSLPDAQQQQQQRRMFAVANSSSSGGGGRVAALRGSLTSSSTLTRAEAAMVQHWFGGEATGNTPAAAHASSAGSGSVTGSSRLAHVLAGNGHAAGLAAAQAMLGDNAAAAAADSQCWGVWRLHTAKGSHYPSSTGMHLPLMSAEDVASGIAAVAFNPAGDAVVAFVESCCCMVVWKTAASWTQKLTSLGSSKPSSHLPHAYIAVPAAAALRQIAGGHEALSSAGQHAACSGLAAGHRTEQHHQRHSQQQQQGGGEMSKWQLKWSAERLVDLLYQGRHCATLEVML
jgi:hypothetical protein